MKVATCAYLKSKTGLEAENEIRKSCIDISTSAHSGVSSLPLMPLCVADSNTKAAGVSDTVND